MRFPAGRWRAQPGKQSACCLPEPELGAARLPSCQGELGLQKCLLSVWLPRLRDRPRNEVQFPLACLVLDLLPLVERGREY